MIQDSEQELNLNTKHAEIGWSSTILLSTCNGVNLFTCRTLPQRIYQITSQADQNSVMQIMFIQSG